MKRLATRTKAHEIIEDFLSADWRAIVQNELEVNLAETGVTVEYAQDFNTY